MKDEQIVDLFLARDEFGISETKSKYGMHLKNIANAIVKDEETAKECENDTYLKTWELIPPNEPRTYFFSFIAKIVRNLAFDYLRKENAIKRSGLLVELTSELEECLSAPGTMVEEKVSEQELGKVISNFLRTLPEQQRKLFVRRYWYGISIQQLAKEFAFSESKVKSKLFRIRNKMREYLRKEGYVL